MKWAPGMRFQFAKENPLGTFAGCIGVIDRRNDGGTTSWWFTMEDHHHPDYTTKPRYHVNEKYMEPVYPEPYGFSSVEQADAWLDSYTVEEAS